MDYATNNAPNPLDFNTAQPQQSFDVIPKGTVAKVRMTIKSGGFDNPARGWTGGYASRNYTSDSVYLNCKFVVLEGTYAKRIVFSLIGLHSPKGAEWGNIGRGFIRAILNSARGFAEKDESPQAIAARNIKSFGDLDGIEFLARIDIEKNKDGQDRNVIKYAIPKGHKDYGKESTQTDGVALPSNMTQPWAR